jgi:hypothetical protein
LSFGRLYGSCDSYSQNAVFSFADRIYLLRRERELKFSPALPCRKSAIKVSPAGSRVIAGRFKRNGRTGSLARSDPAAILFSREELNVETAQAWGAVNEIVADDRLLALARSEKGSPSCRTHQLQIFKRAPQRAPAAAMRPFQERCRTADKDR